MVDENLDLVTVARSGHFGKEFTFKEIEEYFEVKLNRKQRKLVAVSLIFYEEYHKKFKVPEADCDLLDEGLINKIEHLPNKTALENLLVYLGIDREKLIKLENAVALANSYRNKLKERKAMESK